MGLTNRRVRHITEAKFRSWAQTTECDASRTQILLGPTLQAFGGAMLNGDALVLPLGCRVPAHTEHAPPASKPTGSRVPSALSTSTRPARASNLTNGRSTAYHVLKRRPGDAFAFGLPGMSRRPSSWNERC